MERLEDILAWMRRQEPLTFVPARQIWAACIRMAERSTGLTAAQNIELWEDLEEVYLELLCAQGTARHVEEAA